MQILQKIAFKGAYIDKNLILRRKMILKTAKGRVFRKISHIRRECKFRLNTMLFKVKYVGTNRFQLFESFLKVQNVWFVF